MEKYILTDNLKRMLIFENYDSMTKQLGYKSPEAFLSHFLNLSHFFKTHLLFFSKQESSNFVNKLENFT